MGLLDNVKQMVVKLFGIVPSMTQGNIVIRENTTKEISVLKNQLWYRGDPVELEQFYKQVSELSGDSYSVIPQTRFWSASPVGNPLVRKMHSGLPRMIADKLAGIVVEDMREPQMDGAYLSRWNTISKDIDFQELLKEATIQTLSQGDGAFKICIDHDLSAYPLVEFYAGNKVDYEYRRGKLIELVFYTEYYKGSKSYKLIESYGKGYVRYRLVDALDKPCDMSILEETEGLEDVSFEGDYIMGVPLKFYKSAKFEDRGDSIFEGKGDMFDSLDETLSTWMDAMRAGRVKQYIPETLVPRGNDGELLKPDVFNPYITKGSSLGEDDKAIIDVIQGDINYDGLLMTYVTLLDCCLQGLISPSTLGIDVKKLDNAESQREKEKTTMYSRDTLIGVLSKVLPKLVEVVLKTEDNMNNKAPSTDCGEGSFEWGQYANPSFEAMVETVGKAKTFGIMSIEQCVEELYGDGMDEKDKLVEIERLRAELGAATVVAEPSIDDEIGADEVDAE